MEETSSVLLLPLLIPLLLFALASIFAAVAPARGDTLNALIKHLSEDYKDVHRKTSVISLHKNVCYLNSKQGSVSSIVVSKPTRVHMYSF